MKNYLVIGGSNGIGYAITKKLESTPDNNVWGTDNSCKEEHIRNNDRDFLIITYGFLALGKNGGFLTLGTCRRLIE